MMTFEEFQATRKFHLDISKVIEDTRWEDEGPVQGFVYLNQLYIEMVGDHWPEAVRAQGSLYLLLNRDEWISNDLTALEWRLYHWACEEEYCGPRDDYVLVEMHYPDGNNGCLHLDIKPEHLLVGDKWRPGVVATANPYDHYGEEIAYAINEGGVVEGDLENDDNDNDKPVRWSVCQQSIDVLVKHGLIEEPWTIKAPTE